MTIASILLADTWGMHGDDVGTGWMMLMGAGMMFFWVPIILGVVWLVRRAEPASRAPSGSFAGSESPVDILERRFAEGAISEEDYRARRKVLVGEPAGLEGVDKEESVGLPAAGPIP